jgi:hypothetical protein
LSADFRWHDIYTALENLFPRPVERIEAGSSIVLSTALAGIAVMSLSPLPKGWPIALCVSTIVAGLGYQLAIARSHVAGDRNGAYQIGMMLRGIQARLHTSQTEQQPTVSRAAGTGH